MITKEDIIYKCFPYGKIVKIPAGTSLSPALNLPDGGCWVERWHGMSHFETSWLRNYGFHIAESEVKKTVCKP